MFVPVVTLSTKDDNNFLEQLKSGFKRTIKVNRLFVLSFQSEGKRTSFSKRYAPKVKIKDFNVLTDGKSFFDLPVKNKEEACEKIRSINKNDDYTTGMLLDYEYFSNHYKLIAIDLSKNSN